LLASPIDRHTYSNREQIDCDFSVTMILAAPPPLTLARDWSLSFPGIRHGGVADAGE
jgi:hypothetical protein